MKIEQIDKERMFEIYNNWPEIANKSFHKKYEQVNYEEIKHIVFSGMGGSGTIGDIFQAILSKTDIHVSVVKGYLLPNTVNEKALVVTTSVSGNTVETLTVLEQAFQKKTKILALSSGGKMEEYCNERGINFRKVEKFHSPRCSLTSFLYSMLNILKPIIPISTEVIEESIKELEKIKRKISTNNLTKENSALVLAEWINNIPLIYFPNGLQSAAIRFKNSLQENAKNHAIIEDVVESSHNGIVAWEQESSIQPILLEGKEDYVKTKERWRILEDYFKMKKIEHKIIESSEGSILTKLIGLIYMLDYCTIYKAILSNIDPSPITPIEFVKKRL
ncbi:glucose-mannose-6-phosphate isomerase protein [Marine Group I thaumarchaeote SCGC AAA799-E16]|uniref:Glucose-mannose-6-phosphate isomerase protein n=2 Tax=Marine Group I TaxID=905826 RepID=A0A087S265_9ARCH|nr:glucose-mannose-6-phosphate isomerase protein [Marine Group I thaumarchaeote SCGC AAA799-E16]KFM19819.1 glucose-mannose-6-phosphate isomerase protein [Marine Group I thaumarchaeote SCGC RSA3]